MSQPYSAPGNRITPVLDLPLDLRVKRTRVDYALGGHNPGSTRHPRSAFSTSSTARLHGPGERAMRVPRAGDLFYEPLGRCTRGRPTPAGRSPRVSWHSSSRAAKRLVIVRIVLMFVWSFWVGLIVVLIGLVAFGGFARGKWY